MVNDSDSLGNVFNIKRLAKNMIQFIYSESRRSASTEHSTGVSEKSWTKKTRLDQKKVDINVARKISGQGFKRDDGSRRSPHILSLKESVMS